jgi:hypothetical protein
MKITLNMRTVRLAVMTGLTVISSCLTNHVQAQSDPSVLGPAWDLTLSGQGRGVAQIMFNANGTLVGYAQLETLKKAGGGAVDIDDRGSTPDDRGGGSSTNSSSSSTVTNLSGPFGISGAWGFDPSTQRIIGFMDEGGYVVTAISTNAVTNSVTFRGVVRGGTRPRMTLHGISPLGRQVLQGVPLQALPNISGPYAAVGRRGEKPVVEFFTLTATGANNYSVVGSSPGYTYTGNAILSARRKLSISTEADGTNGVNFTVIVGGFNTNYLNTSRSLGTLKGSDSHGPVSLRILDQ